MVAADEILVLNTAALRDDDADGILDLTDPTKGLILNIAKNADGSVTLSFPTVTYRTYVLTRSFTLDGQYSTLRAYFPLNGEFSASYTDLYPSYYQTVSAYYKVSEEEAQ